MHRQFTGGGTFLGRMVQAFSKGSSGCLHNWILQDRSVTAEKTKGKRDKVFVEGDYEECPKCLEGRFVPQNKNLRIVKCRKISDFILEEKMHSTQNNRNESSLNGTDDSRRTDSWSHQD